jgi:hypothetical protein
LLESGVPVRALVRGHDERSERVAALGAEVVVGDLNDYRTLAPAPRTSRSARGPVGRGGVGVDLGAHEVVAQHRDEPVWVEASRAVR